MTKKFATELQGLTVMSDDGRILGTIDNFVVDTKNGDVRHVLLNPAQETDLRQFKTDYRGRLVLPFNKLRSIQDVVVIGPL